MNNMWKKCKLSDIGNVVGGATPSTKEEEYYGGKIPWLTPKDLSSYNERYITSGERNITEKGLKSCSAKLLPSGSILFSSRAPIGYVAIAKNPIATNQGFKSIIPNENIDSLFLYYLLKHNKEKIESMGSGTTFKEVSGATMKSVEVMIPSSLDIQKQIANILGSIDDKIELNNRINANLEEQAQALFRRWFVDFEFPNEQGLPYKSNGGRFVESELGRIPNGWKVFHADEVFHINIGKTPPRKEQEWFSNESKNNIKWVSISDLGGIGVFVNDSKEYLSKDAISKFNIIVVPRNTVLLSFKLTVGRVAIANCKLTTNEAIARFYLPKEYFREYTYLALKNYNYSKLGSTSSIAIAVNSKIIKAMPILIPSDNILKLFNVVMAPVFNIIEKNQTTIENLVSLRDTLLPKLMNNEINL